jgi:hypothetical protein
LFVSHSWDYGDDREDLGKLIVKGLGTQNVYDYSAPKDDPIHVANDEALVRTLYDRINKAHVLVFPAGVYASYSKWIPVEVAIAQHLRKPIIAVETWGAKRSASIAQSAHEIVGWNSNSIADAIRKWHP